MNDNQSEAGWKLEKFEMELETYGENKGKYSAQVRLRNEKLGMVWIKIPPSVANEIITLIKPDLYHALSDISQDQADKLKQYLE